MSGDTAEIQRSRDNRIAEREERLGSDELWNEVKQDGAREEVLGARILCEYSRS